MCSRQEQCSRARDVRAAGLHLFQARWRRKINNRQQSKSFTYLTY